MPKPRVDHEQRESESSEALIERSASRPRHEQLARPEDEDDELDEDEDEQEEDEDEDEEDEEDEDDDDDDEDDEDSIDSDDDELEAQHPATGEDRFEQRLKALTRPNRLIVLGPSGRFRRRARPAG